MQEITCRRHGPFFNVPLGLRPQRIKLYALEPEKKNGCAEVGERPRNAGMSGSDGHEFGFSVVFGVPRVHGTRGYTGCPKFFDVFPHLEWRFERQLHEAAQ